MADVERARRRNNIILGVVMIFLLVGSSLGYSLMSVDGDSENIVSEGGLDFVRENGLWKLMIGNEVFSFQYLPSEVGNVEINLSAELGIYSGQPLYFVNPSDGSSEVLRNLGRYVLRYQESCLDSVDLGGRDSVIDDLGNLTAGDNESVEKIVCVGDLPIKNCDSNLIIFEQGNETRVYGDGNCVFIVGDAVRGSDAFLYEVFGIK